VAQAREKWKADQASLDAGKLVFIEETRGPASPSKLTCGRSTCKAPDDAEHSIDRLRKAGLPETWVLVALRAFPSAIEANFYLDRLRHTIPSVRRVRRQLWVQAV
jgi:hypothetical protein